MNFDILKFISYQIFKNGRKRIYHTTENEINIYKFLFDHGFRFTKINGKRVIYNKTNQEYKITPLFKIKEFFLRHLESEEYFNCPIEIAKDDVLNWFLRDNPIKINGLFEHYLNENISDFEKNILQKIKYP